MVTVKLFGTLRLDTGVKELMCEAESIRRLYPLVAEEIRRSRHDSTIDEKTLRSCLVAVNGRQVSPRTLLHDGDVVYLFPAAAGG